MASEMYIDFGDSIAGGAKDADHTGEVEIMSWNHGFSQPTSPVRSTAGGGTVEQANHMQFSFTKYLDSASDDLIKRCWNGLHIDEVTFAAYRSDGGDNVKYLTIKMETVVVAGYSIGGGPGDIPVENVTLDYAKVTYTYTSQKDEDGTAGGNQEVSHDLVTGTIA